MGPYLLLGLAPACRALSEKAHYLAAAGQDKPLSDVEEEIDHLAGELWGFE